MAKLMALGDNKDYTIINPEIKDIIRYVSSAQGSSFANESFWDGLLYFLRTGENIPASEIYAYGSEKPIIINCGGNIPHLVNKFFDNAGKFGMNRSDFIYVQNLKLKKAGSIIEYLEFVGTAQMFLKK